MSLSLFSGTLDLQKRKKRKYMAILNHDVFLHIRQDQDLISMRHYILVDFTELTTSLQQNRNKALLSLPINYTG